MQFLKLLFWFLLAFVAALFTYGNWHNVPVRLWSGIIADINLPLLLLIALLAGFVPTQLWHAVRRWQLRQRLHAQERTIADLTYAIAPLASITTPPAPPQQAVPPKVILVSEPPSPAPSP